MGKQQRPFNNPFGELKLAKDPPSKPKPPLPRAPAPRVEPKDEGALFRETVGTVVAVKAGPQRTAPPPPRSIDTVRIVDPELEALVQLSELVAGSAPFDLSDAEYIEGCVHGFDAKILRRLRAGDYAVQAHIDLHGRTRAEAKEELELFIEGARRAGKRCVLVVHGRGLHSKDNIPVLKESIRLWLGRGRISKSVLAFASACSHDGGVGAVYVLLRRR